MVNAEAKGGRDLAEARAEADGRVGKVLLVAESVGRAGQGAVVVPVVQVVLEVLEVGIVLARKGLDRAPCMCWRRLKGNGRN